MGYDVGMASQDERDVFRAYEARIRAALNASNPLLAYRIFDEMLNGDEHEWPTYYANVTGMKTNYFNFEQGPDGSSLSSSHFIRWLGSAAGRAAMNVGAQPYAVENATVEKRLLDTWMVGVMEF